MNVLKRLKVGQRLIAAFLIVAAIGGVIGGFGITSLSRINALNDRLYDEELLGISYVKEANIHLITAGRAQARFEQASTPQARDDQKRMLQTAVKDLLSWSNKARPLFTTSAGQELFREFDKQAAAWVKNIDLYLPLMEAHTPGATRDPALDALITNLREANRSLDALMTRLSEHKESQGAAASQEGTNVFEQMRMLLLGLSVLGVVLSVLLGLSITRGIIKPLRSAIDAAKRVANGDLTGHIEVTTQDETGELMRALHEMNASLAHIVGDVRAGSESIASASSQIAQGNTDLSQRTEEQASSLEETAASMEELTSTVQQNANNAYEADKLVAQASAIASQGSTTVGHVVGTMTSIAESSRRISEITGVIDGIAFQTNILALNAAVEAARAGEQGRGFAVVAGEVRNLAQRSATAAREIKGLIEESVSRVQSGTQQAADAGRVMEDVLSSVQRVATLVKEIASASTEQSAGIGQVNQAVSQMDSVTQQNAALVEEAAAAATSLQEQAGQLAGRVRHFKVESDMQQEAYAARVPSRVQAPRAPAARPAVRAVSAARPKPAIAAPVSPATPRSQPVAKASATDDWESF